MRKMFNLSIVFLFILFAMSCGESPNGTTDNNKIPTDDGGGNNLSKQIDPGPFTFYAFDDIAEVDVQGIDSLAKRYVNSQMTIEIDYGWYAGFNNNDSEIALTIDGLDATYYTNDTDARPGYKYFSIIHFENASASDPQIRLNITIDSNREDASDVALAIFETIKFK